MPVTYSPLWLSKPGNVAGRFHNTPKGVILHGSRSGRAQSTHAEFTGTANYAVNEPNGLGWNATVGDDEIALHMTARQWGWNARGVSDDYLAVEFAQPLESYAISDGQVRAFVAFFQHALEEWPQLPTSFPTHAELDGTPAYGGTFDGKTDVFSKGSPNADELRHRIYARLEQMGVTL